MAEESKNKEVNKTMWIALIVLLVFVMFVIVYFSIDDGESPTTNQKKLNDSVINNTVIPPPIKESSSFYGWIIFILIIIVVCGIGFFLYKKNQFIQLSINTRPKFGVYDAQNLIVKEQIEKNLISGVLYPDDTVKWDQQQLKFGTRRTFKIENDWHLQQHFTMTVDPIGHHVALIPLIDKKEILKGNYDIHYNGQEGDFDHKLRKYKKYFRQDVKERVLEKHLELMSNTDPSTLQYQQAQQQLANMGVTVADANMVQSPQQPTKPGGGL